RPSEPAREIASEPASELASEPVVHVDLALARSATTMTSPRALRVMRSAERRAKIGERDGSRARALAMAELADHIAAEIALSAAGRARVVWSSVGGNPGEVQAHHGFNGLDAKVAHLPRDFIDAHYLLFEPLSQSCRPLLS